ncbi:MAP7 domain-containing protein 2-like [Mytilus edulis]|uniref:MAP7 domain-containing protein 2-like n=1 Tax=Mytilus edulis TaxID=6550 RepID=UPI0039F045C8
MDPSHAEQQEEVQPPEGNVTEEIEENPSKTTNVDENAETRRVRELTEKGQGAFIEKRDKFYHDLEALWSNLESQLLETAKPPNDLQQLLTAQDKIVQACTKYRRLTDEYLTFLKNTKTLDSLQDIDTCKFSTDIRMSKVELAIETLHEHRLTLTKAKSTKTRTSKGKTTSHSGSSHVSDISSLARKKRAKAEAARTQIAFAEKQALLLKQEAMIEEQTLFKQNEIKAEAEQEAIRADQEATSRKAEAEQEAIRRNAETAHQRAEMKREAIRRKTLMEQEAARATREKAEIKAAMNILEAQREAAAAEAEARVLEYDGSQAFSDLPDEKEDPLQRVQDFVNKLPVSTVVKEVTGPQKKKQIPVKIELSHEAPAFVPSVALNLLSQTSAVMPSDTKSPEV